MMGHQPHAPQEGKGEDGNHAQAEELHQLVRNDGPRITEQIAGIAVDGTAERGIGGRPGSERHADRQA